jgi:hypothetical protein
MIDKININYQGDKADNTWYIRLGAFLDFVENRLMYHFDVGGITTPALKFDTEVETNLMYIEPSQVSVDPTVCVVRRKLLMSAVYRSPFEVGVGDGGLGEEFESPLFPNLTVTSTDEHPNPYGRIMNIYVSMKFILLKLDELKNADTNKVVLIDFLNNILSAINSSLGGISKLEATLFNETTVVIRDGNPLPNIQEVIKLMKDKKLSKSQFEIYDKYAQFDLYGYSTKNPPNSATDIYGGKGHASFIKEFSLTTEISPELSTMLTVGATANSTVVGENSTAFSKFNAGLTDRFKEKVVYLKDDGTPDTEIIPWASADYTSPEARAKTREEGEQQRLYKELYLKYVYTYKAYGNYVYRLSQKIYNGEADTYKDALNNFITYKQQADSALWAYLVKKDPTKYAIPAKFAPSTGFIPFNMSLTMEGLSGMRIYSKFNIDTEYLPANYPDNADFLIKNINHTISNNKWFTKIESVVISQQGK